MKEEIKHEEKVERLRDEEIIEEEKRVKEYLKTQFKQHGFIEFTLVAEMCINYNRYIINELQEQAIRIEEDFKENEYSLQDIINKIIVDVLNPQAFNL
jgi:hypothetical protein